MTAPGEILSLFVDALKTVEKFIFYFDPEMVRADHVQPPLSKAWGDVLMEMLEGEVIVRYDSTTPVLGEAGVWWRHRYKMAWKRADTPFEEVFVVLTNAVLPATGRRLLHEQLHANVGAIAHMEIRTVPMILGDSVKDAVLVTFGVDDRDP